MVKKFAKYDTNSTGKKQRMIFNDNRFTSS